MSMLALSTICAAARARARREDGAIALLTMAFMVVLGLVATVTLWSIGFATGAYNSLYATTQSAAYAAVGQTVPAAAGSAQAQLDFNCNPEPNPGTNGNPVCSGGTVIGIVDAIFAAAYPANATNFGLCWGGFASCSGSGKVQLADASNDYNAFANPTVYAYYIPSTPGAAQAQWNDPTIPKTSATCPASTDENGLAGPLLCWSLVDSSGQVTNQFTSGVVVAAVASVRLPGCGAICPYLQLHVAVAASEAQPSASS